MEAELCLDLKIFQFQQNLKQFAYLKAVGLHCRDAEWQQEHKENNSSVIYKVSLKQETRCWRMMLFIFVSIQQPKRDEKEKIIYQYFFNCHIVLGLAVTWLLEKKVGLQ